LTCRRKIIPVRESDYMFLTGGLRGHKFNNQYQGNWINISNPKKQYENVCLVLSEDFSIHGKIITLQTG
jgi:hypothetical protein